MELRRLLPSDFRSVMISETLENNEMNPVILDEELAPEKGTISELVEDELREQSTSMDEETISSPNKLTGSAEISTTGSVLSDILLETNGLDVEGCVVNAGAVDKKLSSRVQIRNMPPYLRYKQVKELLSKYVRVFC